MNSHIDAIATALAGLVNGESAPPMMSSEFLEIMGALANVKQADFEAIGQHATTILLERLQSGMEAERTLKVMRGSDNPMRLN